jgi:hypothetical protein
MTARVGRQQHAADLFAAPTLPEAGSPTSHRVLAAKRGFLNGRCEAVYGGGATDLGDMICRSHGTNRTTGQWVPSGSSCLFNSDVVDLHDRTSVGAKVRQRPEN